MSRRPPSSTRTATLLPFTTLVRSIAGGGGARGYTPFKTEIAKDAEAVDLKEFWHVGRDLPEGHKYARDMAPNVWPDRPGGFRDAFIELFAALDRKSTRLTSSHSCASRMPSFA